MVDGEIGASVRRLVEEGIGRGDLAVIEDMIAPDEIEHQRGHAPGIDGVRQLSDDLHRRIAGLELQVEDIAVVGDRVWLRSRARGVSTGTFMGAGPTGRPVEVEVFDLVRIAGGRIVEHWGVADQLGLLLQLGFDPTRETAAAAR